MPTTHDRMVGPGGVRSIVARWVIIGELVLDSAAHLGNGEEGETVDMALVRDRAENLPLLSGSSLAGGLRSYSLDLLDGYAQEEPTTRDGRSANQGQADRAKQLKIVADLFGGARGDDEGSQSSLIVFDSVCHPPENWAPEIRDGVAIEARTGLAEDHKKFDLELLPPKTKFPLRFELIVADTEAEADQVSLLVAALSGLEKGEIPIGARRSRGLGACHATSWRVKRFDLASAQGWLDWLGSDHRQPFPRDGVSVTAIAQAVSMASGATALLNQQDKRARIRITVCLVLDAGLLVRSPGTRAADADVTHLFSGGKAVFPGTSLAGVLRARALRITRVVRSGKNDAETWVDDLFGPRLMGTTDPNFQPYASRLKITEKPIADSQRLRPNRIRIDRFTGGVVDGALFDEEPVYRGQVEVALELQNPRPGEIGLVLLLLKDLLTGDLPVGGTSSVGRGVLKGTATVIINDTDYTLDPNKQPNAKTIQVLDDKVKEFHNADSLVAAVDEEKIE